MKKTLVLSALLLAFILTITGASFAEQLPEAIAEKMAIKFTRGVVNTFTCIVELPKQTVLSVRDLGTAGYLIGPMKGFGMTLYRGFIGMAETIFFPVPQPGYYDPMIEPAYVWEGWEPRRDTTPAVSEEK